MNASRTLGGRLRLCTYQLAVAKASLGRAGASATFHPLLFAFRWPGGKHGGVNRKGGLSEVLVLQPIFGSNSSGWVICQKAEESLGKQLNREDTRWVGVAERRKNLFPKFFRNSSEILFSIF